MTYQAWMGLCSHLILSGGKWLRIYHETIPDTSGLGFPPHEITIVYTYQAGTHWSLCHDIASGDVGEIIDNILSTN